jgi:hypothetical protein
MLLSPRSLLITPRDARNAGNADEPLGNLQKKNEEKNEENLTCAVSPGSMPISCYVILELVISPVFPLTRGLYTGSSDHRTHALIRR